MTHRQFWQMPTSGAASLNGWPCTSLGCWSHQAQRWTGSYQSLGRCLQLQPRWLCHLSISRCSCTAAVRNAQGLHVAPPDELPQLTHAVLGEDAQHVDCQLEDAGPLWPLNEASAWRDQAAAAVGPRYQGWCPGCGHVTRPHVLCPHQAGDSPEGVC